MYFGGLTGAGTCLAFVFVAEAGRCSQQAAGVKQAAAVLVRRGDGVGGVGRYGVVGGGRGLAAAHGGQAAAPQRTRALHLHPLRQRHLVLNRFLLVHPGGGGRRGAGVRGHVLRRRRGEGVQVGAGVGRRRQRGRGDGVGVAGARVDGGEAAGGRGAMVVQAGLAEGADGPGVVVVVVVVVSRERRLASVQPGDPRAVEEVRPADLSPREASCRRATRMFYLPGKASLIQKKKKAETC